MNTTSYVGILLLLAGAPKSGDGGICESLLPHPLDSPLSNPGESLRRGMTAAAGLYQFRYLVSGAGRSSPIRNLVWLSVFGLVSFAFQ